jgi:uncharacterized repeat protein (TIGR03803 family)
MVRFLAALVILSCVTCLLHPAGLHGGTCNVIYSFAGPLDDGADPYGSLTYYDGRIYGMTAGGGINWTSGTIFSINPDGTGYVIHHSFTGQPDDGEWPHNGLYVLNGIMYGMTFAGGCNGTNCVNYDSNGCGTIFFMRPDGMDYAVLWNFACGGGDLGAALPGANFVSDGLKLYGTTGYGGQFDPLAGTVFSIDPDGSNFTVLHSFQFPEGMLPQRGCILVNDTLYGVTCTGGSGGFLGNGTIFSVRTDGTGFTTLRDFVSDADGIAPCGTLTFYNNLLYGTAVSGGSNNDGTIFSIKPDGSDFTVIHDFSDEEGAGPYEGVTVVGNRLYGVTTHGGNDNAGVIYSLNPDGSDYTVLHKFQGDVDGFRSESKLLYEGNCLYGTNAGGGAWGYGTLFKYDLSGGPTPTPTPAHLRLTLSSQTPRPGETFTVDVSLDPVAGAFDAYIGIAVPDGTFYSLSKGGGLVKGVRALYSKVKGLRSPYAARLFTGTVPPRAGVYQVIAGLVPEGVAPSTVNAIPDYLDQKTVIVQ